MISAHRIGKRVHIAVDLGLGLDSPRTQFHLEAPNETYAELLKERIKDRLLVRELKTGHVQHQRDRLLQAIKAFNQTGGTGNDCTEALRKPKPPSCDCAGIGLCCIAWEVAREIGAE